MLTDEDVAGIDMRLERMEGAQQEVVELLGKAVEHLERISGVLAAITSTESAAESSVGAQYARFASGGTARRGSE